MTLMSERPRLVDQRSLTQVGLRFSGLGFGACYHLKPSGLWLQAEW